MDAKDRLLTKEEWEAIVVALPVEATCGQGREAIAQAQDAKTLKALRPIVEDTADHLCHHPVSFTLGPGLGAMSHYKDCGLCATCLARKLLDEMDAQAKGKEGEEC